MAVFYFARLLTVYIITGNVLTCSQSVNCEMNLSYISSNWTKSFESSRKENKIKSFCRR